jgi:hypothetical protein
MLTRILISILALTTLSCRQHSDEKSETEIVKQTTSLQRQYPQIDTDKIFISDSYYQFVRLTDSTSTVKWGNKSFSNFCKDTSDNFFFDKERIQLKWSNNKFIAIGRGAGSDTWFQIILPLTKDADLKIYENPLATDKDNDIIIYEYNSDTVLVAENMTTGKKQIIGTNGKKCSSAFSHYCIDSISVSKKQLYIKWTLPNKIEEHNKTEIKRISLDI